MAEFRLSNFTSGVALTAAELNTGLTYATYTPDWTQSATITKTVNWARYTKFGKLVIGSVKMTSTSAGTANNKIIVSLPIAANANNFQIGSGYFTDISDTPDRLRPLMAVYESSTTASFTIYDGQVNVADTLRFGQTGVASDTTIASGDIIWMTFQYEAA